MEASNTKAMHEVLEAINCINTRGLKRLLCELVEADIFDGGLINKTIFAIEKARHALSAPEMEMEANNAAAMHEALDSVNKIYDMLSKPCIVIEEVRQECQKARAVLISAPPRNCDVGTPEEQFKRYLAFCHSESRGCKHCPANETRLRGTSNCDLAWAQMPYKDAEGGAKMEGGGYVD